MLYIFGHKSPDTDTICSAIAYSYLKNQLGEEAQAFRLGEPDDETRFVLKKFSVSLPPLLDSAKGKDVIMVDHNEFEQSANDIEEANIVEIIDHHKLKFSWDKPIFILTIPLGSTSTIISKLFEFKKIEIPENIAGLLLSAILSDTSILTSPETTEIDKNGIENVLEYGIKLLKIKTKIPEKSPREIILGDYKVYEFNGRKVLIGQVKTIDDKEVLERKEEIFEEMRKIKEENKLFGVLLMITDILKEGSTLVVVADDIKPFEKAFNIRLDSGFAWLEGAISRKKQIVPPLERIFER